MKKNFNIVITLIIASVLIATLSLFMPKDKEKYLRDQFWVKKTFAPSVYDVVLMGDSRIERGVSPEIMEKILPGMNVLNFGYSNGGLNPTMYEAAEKKLSKTGKKKVIILGVTANCITPYTLKNEQFLQVKKLPREDVIERMYLNRILYQFSATTPEGLWNYFKNEKPATVSINEYYDNGYVKSGRIPIDTMYAIPSYIDDYTNYKVDEKIIADMVSQIKQWNEKGIVVVGFRPPVTVPMKTLEDTMGFYNEAAISARFNEAGGHWIHLNSTEYKTYDGSHLDLASAMKLSEVLAHQVSGILAQPEK